MVLYLPLEYLFGSVGVEVDNKRKRVGSHKLRHRLGCDLTGEKKTTFVKSPYNNNGESPSILSFEDFFTGSYPENNIFNCGSGF